MPRQEGSFLAIFRCGGRERGASIASGCKPRFAGFAVCRGAGSEVERVRILCVPLPGKSSNPLPGLDLQGYARLGGKGWELNSHPWNRKTVTPISASTGGGFSRFQGRKMANRPPWNLAEEKGLR
jgi:hypothetical protein